jgi:ABC-type antimicrobial peptide transport system permease subunit
MAKRLFRGSAARLLAANEFKEHRRIYVVIIFAIGITMATFLLATCYEFYMQQVINEGIKNGISSDALIMAPEMTVRDAIGGARVMPYASQIAEAINATGRYNVTMRTVFQGAAFYGGMEFGTAGRYEGAIIEGIDLKTDSRVFDLKETIIDGQWFDDYVSEHPDSLQGDFGAQMVASLAYILNEFMYSEWANLPIIGPILQALRPGFELFQKEAFARTTAYPALVGRALSELTGLKVGDEFTVLIEKGGNLGNFTFARYKAIGIYDIGLPLMEQMIIITPMDGLRQVAGKAFNEGAATTIALKSPSIPPSDHEAIKNDLMSITSNIEVVMPDGTRNVVKPVVLSWHDVLVYTSGTMFDTVTYLLIFSIIFILALCGVLIYYVMDSIVLRKMRQIGIIKAMGATNNTVGLSFLYQALFVGLCASAVGLVLGYVALYSVQQMGLQTFLQIGTAARIATPISISYVVQPWALIMTLAIPVGVSLLASLLPAAHAASLDPVECIRRGEGAL